MTKTTRTAARPHDELDRLALMPVVLGGPSIRRRAPRRPMVLPTSTAPSTLADHHSLQLPR